MPVTVLLASAAVVASIGLAWWAIGADHADPLARARLASLGGSGTPGSRGAAHRVGTSVSRLHFLRGVVGSLDASMARAGLGPSWTLERVLILKAALAGGILVLGLPWALAQGSAPLVLIVAFAAFTGWLLPDLQISGRAAERQRKIERQLPDLLDKITISVEAGLGFDSALARVVRSGIGPVYDEFRGVLQDLQLGLPRDTALQSLAARTSVRDLRLFLTAVIQSTQYGLPLGNVMRVQSAELREKRKFRAEERAMKVPVKIVMPLILCILPTLFIVVVGPVFVRLSGQSLFG